MSPQISAACVVALLLMSVAPAPGAAQGPDLPQVPRLSGICQITDGPSRGWAGYASSALGVRVSRPPEWSPRERGKRIEFVAADRVMLLVREVNIEGAAPAVWLRRARTPEGGRCHAVVLGTFRGRQCFDPAAGRWTTFLMTSHRVVAVEVPGTLAREIHCGVLMSFEDLWRR